MAKIHAPNEQYTGLSATVMFNNGVGETADPHLIDWFRSKGYLVEEEETESDSELTVKQIKERLDALDIEYGAKDKKADLLEKLKLAESEPDEDPNDPETETESDADPSDETDPETENETETVEEETDAELSVEDE